MKLWKLDPCGLPDRPLEQPHSTWPVGPAFVAPAYVAREGPPSRRSELLSVPGRPSHVPITLYFSQTVQTHLE